MLPEYAEAAAHRGNVFVEECGVWRLFMGGVLGMMDVMVVGLGGLGSRGWIGIENVLWEASDNQIRDFFEFSTSKLINQQL